MGGKGEGTGTTRFISTAIVLVSNKPFLIYLCFCSYHLQVETPVSADLTALL